MNSESFDQNVEGAGLTPGRFGYYSALLTVILTIVSFGFALYAIPISGANCPGDCVEYPYLDTVERFPRDFMWMPLAILMILSYVTWMVSIHAYAPGNRKIFSQGAFFRLDVGDHPVECVLHPVFRHTGQPDEW